MTGNLRIDGARLWDSLMEMARIGATEKGGVCRLALTDLDRRSRDLFVSWCEAAGCAVTVDAMGNIFARRPGRDPDLAPIMTGSHLDSQPTGGRFDGVYGVLAALEVVRALDDHGIETEAPVEVAVWTNEEGARFAPAMVGSGVFAGEFDLAYGQSREDGDGKTIGAELERIGYRGSETPGDHPVGAFFEVHIEQGPILEAEEKTIGVVQGVQGMRWYDVTLTGAEAHAGPTPMDRRRDPLAAAGDILPEIYRIALDRPPHGRATIGEFHVSPGSRNTIPGSVQFAVDLRHPDRDVLADMDTALKTLVAGKAGARDIGHEVADIWESQPVRFDADCVAAVAAGAKLMGYDAMDVVSGAGHDAVYVSRVAPVGMIFIPCKDGISHNEIEDALPEHVEAGANVLLHAVLNRAGVAGKS